MHARRALEVVAVALLVAVVVGQALGHPVLLGYVVSGSMSPTLDRGDGFVAVPAVLADSPEVGDVVVYRAQRVQGGGLVTHRVVGRTDAGYVTRGDANPFTDQAGPEPPVPESRVIAVALEFDGEVVVVPGVGAAVLGFRDVATTFGEHLGVDVGPAGLGLLVFGLGLVLYALGRGSHGRRVRERVRSRSRAGSVDAGRVALLLALLVVLPAIASMVAPAGAHTVEMVSSETGADRGRVVAAGDEVTRSIAVANGGVLPVVTYLEPTSDGVSVGRERTVVAPGARRVVPVTVRAPAETGYYVRTVAEHRYLLVLPLPVVDALYRVHPWLPALATAGGLAAATLLVARATLGRGRLRFRRRSRSPGRR